MRILIAGLGAIGQRHARNLRALRGSGVELLAYRRRGLKHVVTESLTRDDSRDVEADLGLKAFDDLGVALAEKPDAVFVCTPTSQHLEIALRAAGAGCHLFIEKPVSHTLDGVEALVATVARHRLVALVGCQWRYHPCVISLRALIGRGALGELRSAEIEYAEYLPDWHPYEDYRQSYAASADLGGGVVLTQIHDYDLAWWLFGQPASVRAAGGHLSSLQIDVEDTVDATLETRSGPVRVRQTFAARPPRRTITVCGSRGEVTVDLLAARLSVSPATLAPQEHYADYQRNELFLAEATHFLSCLETGATPEIPLSEGVAVLKVALGVKEAMHSGGVVRFS
ncbi:MAG: Gfo/Idh/MocA family protein [Gemmatimonadales bacterium]